MIRPVVYTFGPYSGDVEKNIRNAAEIAAQLWDMGYAVLCPHTNTAHFEHKCQVTTYEGFLQGYLVFVERSDLLVGLPNWGQSPGGKLEKAHAEKLHIPVYIWPHVPSSEDFVCTMIVESARRG